MSTAESLENKRPKILVVEDDAPVQRMYALRLEHKGFDVITASTAREAIRKAKDQQPDLILLDLLLPDQDGYVVCRSIRRAIETKDIPIIMISGSVKLRGVQARRAGITAVMYKPVSLAALVKKVNDILAGSPGAAISEEGTAEARSPVQSPMHHAGPAAATE